MYFKNFLLNFFVKKRGLSHKIAQLLSPKNSDIHSHYSKTYYTPEQLKAQFRQYPLELDPKPIAISSIAQIHQGQYQNKPVIVKILLPNIENQINDDLTQLRLIGAPYIKKKNLSYEWPKYQQVIHRQLKNEINYKTESENFSYLKSLGIDSTSLLPEVYLTENNFIVIEKKVGPFLDQLPIDQLPEALSLLLSFLLRGLWLDHFIQSDVHIANFSFTKKKLIIYDYGGFLKVSKQQADSLWLLFYWVAEQKEDNAGIKKTLNNLGFRIELLTPLWDDLFKIIKILFGPFFQMYNFKNYTKHVKDEINSLCKEHRYQLRTAASADFFLVVKFFIGIVNLLSLNDNEINLSTVFNSYLNPRFYRDKLACIQEDGLNPNYSFSSRTAQKASLLEIEVKEHGQFKVKLTFEAKKVAILAELIPDDILDKIKQRGIDFMAIAQPYQELNEFEKGLVFKTTLDEKEIIIELI